MAEQKRKAISLDDLKNDGFDVVQEGDQILPKEPVAAQPQPVEPVVEPPKAQEPVAEPPKVEPKAEPQQQPDTSSLNKPADQVQIDVLNKLVGKSYKSIDQLKADLDKPTMESEYQETQSRYAELEAKYKELNDTYELLSEQLDPKSYFSSEEAMKLEIFKKQNPKKDASIATKVFSTEDLSTIDDLDMVKMGRRFKNPRLPGTDADLEVAIMEELNIEPGTPKSEWSNTAQIRLATMAGEYRDAFDQMKSSVSLPERVNIDQLKEQRKQAQSEKAKALEEGWTKIAEEIGKSTTKIKVPIGDPKDGEQQQFFEWDLGKAPQSEVAQLKEDFIALGMDPNDEGKGAFNDVLEATLLRDNVAQIMQKYGDDLVARAKEKWLEESHNAEPLKDSQRSPQESGGDKAKKERSDFALEGLGSGFTGQRLF